MRKFCCKINTSKFSKQEWIFVTKTDFDKSLKNLNKSVTSNKTTYALLQNELNEL